MASSSRSTVGRSGCASSLKRRLLCCFNDPPPEFVPLPPSPVPDDYNAAGVRPNIVRPSSAPVSASDQLATRNINNVEQKLVEQPQVTAASNSNINLEQIKRKQKLNLELMPEVTTEDLDALQAFIKAQLVGHLDLSAKAAGSSANTSSLSSRVSKWQQHKEVAGSLIQSIPQEITQEAVGATENVLLPLVKGALGGAGGVHWMGLGFSLIAWSLENMQNVQQNKEDCLHLLEEVVFLLKATKTILEYGAPNEYEEDIQATIDKSLRCALICTANLNDSRILKFFKAPSTKDALANLKEECREARGKIQAIGTIMLLHSTSTDLPTQISYTSTNKDIVGGDKYFKQAMDSFNADHDGEGKIVAICLHGMGGIGKSTLAMRIYGQFQEEYNSSLTKEKLICCRVEFALNILRDDIKNSQQHILGILCGTKVHDIQNAFDGRAKLEKALKNLHLGVFLYIDNIMESSDLAELLPEESCFPRGSKILVTTRNTNVFDKLKTLNYKCSLISLTKLDNDAASKLFLQQFENQGEMIPSTNEATVLVEQVLELCDGLPLALKLVGSYIASKVSSDLEIWQDVVHAMNKAESLEGEIDDPLYSHLGFSIDKLGPSIKRAFFDIVAFGRGKPWDRVEHLVESRHMKGLLQRALIEKRHQDSIDIVELHDVLHTLGEAAASKSEEEFHITSSDKFNDNTKPLTNLVGLSNVRISANLLTEMPHLCTLENVEIEGECKDALLKELRVVWDVTSDTSTPFNLTACNCLKDLTWHVVEECNHVEVGELYKGLQSLHLDRWETLENVEGLERLRGLTELMLVECGQITCSPEGMTTLIGLRKLSFHGCWQLQSLPEGIASLTSLMELDLGGCKSLHNLPDGIAGLTGLIKLDLSSCESLQVLPQGIACLTRLKEINLSWCTGLKALPDRIAECMTGLTELNLYKCTGLQALPEGIFACLTSLAKMRLSFCEGLKVLPDRIADMTGLIELDLSGCAGLEVLPEGIACLTRLQKLGLSFCAGLKSLPDKLTDLTGLMELDLSRCEGLEVLPEGIACLTSLKIISLNFCERLEALPDGFTCLTGLTSNLDLDCCYKLAYLPEGIGSLTGLTKLSMHACRSLHSLPEGIGSLTGLISLSLSSCDGLESIPQGITCLTGLRTLDLSSCARLTRLPEDMGSSLQSLCSLYLSYCKSLEALPEGITKLRSLEDLHLRGCDSLQALPEGMTNLRSLEVLKLTECKSLKSIPEGQVVAASLAENPYRMQGFWYGFLVWV